MKVSDSPRCFGEKHGGDSLSENFFNKNVALFREIYFALQKKPGDVRKTAEQRKKTKRHFKGILVSLGAQIGGYLRINF